VAAVDTAAPVSGPPLAGLRRLWGWRYRRDLLAGVVYLAGAVWVAGHLWTDPSGRVMTAFPGDQYQFEFWLEHAVRVVHGASPFHTDRLGTPAGVNMMANTSTYGLTVPLAPVTMLLGPGVAYAVMVTWALCSTAWCWFLLFSRRLGARWLPAVVGGGFCGFAPGMVAQASVHPNIAAQAAVPLIVWQILRIRDRVPVWRVGAALAGLVVYQFFINEEILLITAAGCALFTAVWVVLHHREARQLVGRFAAVLGIAAGAAGALLGYPLWFQFAGPGHYQGLANTTLGYGNDVWAFTAWAPGELLGDGSAIRLAPNPAEVNTFFGLSLLLAGVAVVAGWRHTAVRAAAISGVVLGVLSLGPVLRVNGRYLGPGPWWPLQKLPVLDSVITTRLALGLIPCIAVALVVFLDGLLRVPRRRVYALAWCLPLLPLAPLPLPAVGRPAMPVFFTDGRWRAWLPEGDTVVAVPPSDADGPMRWAVHEQLGFPLVGGYFLGPDPGRGGVARFGPPSRPTARLWAAVAAGGRRVVDAAARRQAATDLAFWRAGLVVLRADRARAAQLRQVTTDLLGFAPTWDGGVWVWRLPGPQQPDPLADGAPGGVVDRVSVVSSQASRAPRRVSVPGAAGTPGMDG
jgi:hypothetical protein